MSRLFPPPEQAAGRSCFSMIRAVMVMVISFVLRIFSLARCPAAVSTGSRGCQVLQRVHRRDSASDCHVLADLCVRASLLACGSCRGMDPIQEQHTSFKDLWSPSKPEGVVQLLLPGCTGVTRCRDVLVALFLLAYLAEDSHEGAVEVTLISLPRFCAKHWRLGCFWSWKAFPCCVWFQDLIDDLGRKNILASATEKEINKRRLSSRSFLGRLSCTPCFGSSCRCGITSSTRSRTFWSLSVCA